MRRDAADFGLPMVFPPGRVPVRDGTVVAKLGVVQGIVELSSTSALPHVPRSTEGAGV
jgi:hypothetical protein